MLVIDTQRTYTEYLLSAVLVHNLNREMQMLSYRQERNTTEKRAPLWYFEQLGTLRRKLIQRAGRLTRPQGKLALTMSANPAVESELLHYLEVLENSVTLSRPKFMQWLG